MRKATATALILIAAVMLIAGCSKGSDTQRLSGDQALESSPQGEDFIDQTDTNPDIGMLDDSPVSESLPQ